MRLQFWAANALTGDVLGELPVQGASFTREFGGGSFSGDVVLEALDQHQDVSWAEAQRRLDLIRPGHRSIIVTGTRMSPDGEAHFGPDPLRGAGRTLIGEWLVTSRTLSTHDGVARIDGIGWEAYPAAVAQDATIRVTNVNPILEAMTLLDRVFFNIQVDVRGPAVPNPTTVDMDRPAWSGPISDALRELQEQGAGFDWVVGVNPVWDGERLASVERVITWGIPKHWHSVDMHLEAGSWGTNHGNCTVARSEELSRWARRVSALGSGEGGKQLFAAALGSTIGGRVDSTRVVSFPNITSQAALQQAADGELARHASMEGAYDIEIDISRIRFLPRLGTRIYLKHGRSPAFPAGLDRTLRVGRINFSSGTEPVLERLLVKAEVV